MLDDSGQNPWPSNREGQCRPFHRPQQKVSHVVNCPLPSPVAATDAGPGQAQTAAGASPASANAGSSPQTTISSQPPQTAHVSPTPTSSGERSGELPVYRPNCPPFTLWQDVDCPFLANSVRRTTQSVCPDAGGDGQQVWHPPRSGTRLPRRRCTTYFRRRQSEPAASPPGAGGYRP